MFPHNRPLTLAELKKRIIGDSLQRKSDLDKLIKLIRKGEVK